MMKSENYCLCNYTWFINYAVAAEDASLDCTQDTTSSRVATKHPTFCSFCLNGAASFFT